MSSFNKVILIGNVGKNPEARYKDNGALIVSFSLATSESWKDKNTGEKTERTEWHKVVVFNEGLARVADSYL